MENFSEDIPTEQPRNTCYDCPTNGCGAKFSTPEALSAHLNLTAACGCKPKCEGGHDKELNCHYPAGCPNAGNHALGKAGCGHFLCIGDHEKDSSDCHYPNNCPNGGKHEKCDSCKRPLCVCAKNPHCPMCFSPPNVGGPHQPRDPFLCVSMHWYCFTGCSSPQPPCRPMGWP